MLFCYHYFHESIFTKLCLIIQQRQQQQQQRRQQQQQQQRRRQQQQQQQPLKIVDHANIARMPNVLANFTGKYSVFTKATVHYGWNNASLRAQAAFLVVTDLKANINI